MGLVIKVVGTVSVRNDTFEIISGEREKELENQRALKVNEVRKKLELVTVESEALNRETWVDVAAQIKKLDELQNIEKALRAELLKSQLPVFEKRKAWGIILYSEGAYFDYFFSKHVWHNLRQVREDDRISTVLVIDGDTIYPGDEEKAREIAQKALESAIRNFTFREALHEQYGDIEQLVPGHILAVREWDFTVGGWLQASEKGVFVFRDFRKIQSPANELKREAKEEKLTWYDIDEAQRVVVESKKPNADYAVKYVIFIDKYFVAPKRRVFG